MGLSLRDQLLKAGAVSKKQHQQVCTRKKKNRKSGQEDESSASKAIAQKAREEQVARDRELNRQQEALRTRRAIQAQIRQLARDHQIAREEGETPYRFNDRGTIKKWYISDKQLDRIANGQLAVIGLDDEYYLVPHQIAEKIAERDGAAVLVLNTRKDGDEEDPYADYQIPDDLMW